jgi:hypothetical protein
MEAPIQVDLSSPILNLSGFLGILAPIWPEREELNLILFREEDFSSELVLSIPFEIINVLKSCYKHALTMKISLGGAILFDISNVLTEDAYQQFHDVVRSSNSPTFIFEFLIDKQLLISIYHQILNQETHAFLYIFPEAFEKLLVKSTLKQIESALWKNEPDSKVIIIIPSFSIFLDGSQFSIIGGDYLKDFELTSPVGQRRFSQRNDIYDHCQNMVKWQDHYINFLTPYHLHFTICKDTDNKISQSLFIHSANLILLYIADRSVYRNNQLIYFFNSIQQSLELKQATPGDLKFNDIGSKVDFLFGLFEWTYDPNWKVSDRLPLVQIGFVQALCSSEAEYRYRLMLENIASIFDALKWHWKAFIEGKVEEYINQVQDLEQVVSDTVKTFTDQISQLNKYLLETMLAAVGVVIASFIAFLFSDRFSPAVFQIGIWVYCIYMFIFPMLISINQQNSQFTVYVENFEIRRKLFEERLYKEKVQSIIGDQIDKNRARYKKAIYYTRLTYILVIFTLFLSSFILPPLIQRFISNQLPNQSSIISSATQSVILSETPTLMPSPTIIPSTASTNVTSVTITPIPSTPLP